MAPLSDCLRRHIRELHASIFDHRHGCAFPCPTQVRARYLTPLGSSFLISPDTSYDLPADLALHTIIPPARHGPSAAVRPDVPPPHSLALGDHRRDDLGAVVAIALAMRDAGDSPAQCLRHRDVAFIPGRADAIDRQSADVADREAAKAGALGAHCLGIVEVLPSGTG